MLTTPSRSRQRSPAVNEEIDTNNPYPVSGRVEPGQQPLSTRAALSQILNATSEDAGNLFNKIDENFLKPHLLLDPGGAGGKGGGPSGGGVAS